MDVIPGEWAQHRAMWLGFPSHADLWQENLPLAQAQVAALARALVVEGGEAVGLLCHGDEALAAARGLLGDLEGRLTFVPGRFGDIWLRDTGPLFFAGGRLAVGFGFNGWGGKYDLPYDDTVAGQLAHHTGAALRRLPFVIEGGALDHDGLGTVLTTRQCLLHPNRNEGWDEAVAEAALADAIGARKVIWLGDGLLNDHTDGHVDNLARFLAPGVVACPIATGADDPNAEVYEATAAALAVATDARGERLTVVRVPSPGLVTDEDGEIVPASHMNFLIADRAVIVPVYSADRAPGEAAVAALAPHFPGRVVLALPSDGILTGGGSFHCITQQVPA